MSSLFTFNPSPSPPASPWNSALGSPNPGASRTTTPLNGKHKNASSHDQPVVSLAPGVKSLESEPQVGPVEYKLSIVNPTPARLQHLTTQMLWRMQQSCESHNTAAAPPPISAFDEDSSIGNQSEAKVDKNYYAALLQDTQGCFYEIGVADDGRLVGLPEWELEQSLKSLNKMASALGCKAEVVRRITVAKKTDDQGKEVPLIVAEAHITPCQFQKRSGSQSPAPQLTLNGDSVASSAPVPHPIAVTPPQLRVALFGPTGAGKSTLIGTLTTEKLDNGLGAVRYSILRHLHELQTGVTSSIANELLGFNRAGDVVNYCTGNVSSWMDIHAAVSAGAPSNSDEDTTVDQSRTVLLLDSAGRFRYRRTAIRVLMGWAPHYACVLLASNTLSSDRATSSAAFNYLTLCLKLEIPTVAVITKWDVGEKNAVRELYQALFATVRSFGKQPKVIDHSDPKKVAAYFQGHSAEVTAGNVVPVLIVSSLNGKGIPSFLATLRTLPIPEPAPLQNAEEESNNLDTPGLQTLFHIEEKYDCTTPGCDFVVAGHVKYGHVTIGDELLLGPFPKVNNWATPSSSYTESGKWNGRSTTPSSDDGHLGRRFPSRRNSHHSTSSASDDDEGAAGEWRTVRVVSVRKCRAPVGVLNAGEAGTVGVAWDRDGLGTDGSTDVDDITARTASMTLNVPAPSKPAPIQKSVSFAGELPVSTSVNTSLSSASVRKGLVLLNRYPRDGASVSKGHFWPKIATGFAAEFDPGETEGLGKGGDVIVYFGSVRAKAKVDRIEVVDPITATNTSSAHTRDGLFGFDEEDNNTTTSTTMTAAEGNGGIVVPDGRKVRYWFLFSQSLEWIERGVTVLVTDFRMRNEEGMASGLGEAMVGRIVEVEEI